MSDLPVCYYVYGIWYMVGIHCEAGAAKWGRGEADKCLSLHLTSQEEQTNGTDWLTVCDQGLFPFIVISPIS